MPTEAYSVVAMENLFFSYASAVNGGWSERIQRSLIRRNRDMLKEKSFGVFQLEPCPPAQEYSPL